MGQQRYRCKDCGHEVVVDEQAMPPDCCGEKMTPIPLEPCDHAHSAEMQRASSLDEACDDGVK